MVKNHNADDLEYPSRWKSKKKKKNYEYGNVSNAQNTACSFYITENFVSGMVLSTVINTFAVMKQQSLTLMCNNLNIITMYYQNLTSN